MSAAACLIADLNAAGITLEINDSHLVAHPADRLTDDHRQRIRTHKAEIMALLPPGLSPQDHALAVAFLDHIGEDDPAMRAEYLANLAAHPRLIAGMRELARRAGIQEPKP